MEVVTFGETMVVFNPGQMLPLEYVHSYHPQIAGAESNVAIGLHRLGHAAGWFGKLGNDPFGRYVHKQIRGEGVDTSRCIYTDEAPTGLFFKEKMSPENIRVFYYRKSSAASFLTPEDLDESYIAAAKMLHLTGITPALSRSCLDTVLKAIDIAMKHGLKIVLDPNIRLKLWGKEEAREVLLKLAGLVDYVLPGIEEGELLTGYLKPEMIAEKLLEGGASAVVIKLGSRGAYYRTREESGYVPGFPVPAVVDPIGAGDGFAAGLISGLLRNDSLKDAVKRGNAVGAIVVGVNGDIEGLPGREQVEEMLAGKVILTDVKR